MSKPEALRLADRLEGRWALHPEMQEAAAELRRLHEAHDWQYRMAGERLRRIEKLEAQRDALLKALKRMASIIDKLGDMPDGFIHPSPWQTLKCEEALEQALAAIKAVEEKK